MLPIPQAKINIVLIIFVLREARELSESFLQSQNKKRVNIFRKLKKEFKLGLMAYSLGKAVPCSV